MSDTLNAIFELVGGVLLWGSVRRLWVDREIKGVFWPAWFFYTAWGVWNLYYYPSLGQWWSFCGGLVVVSANLAWCSVAVWLWLSKSKTKE